MNEMTLPLTLSPARYNTRDLRALLYKGMGRSTRSFSFTNLGLAGGSGAGLLMKEFFPLARGSFELLIFQPELTLGRGLGLGLGLALGLACLRYLREETIRSTESGRLSHE